MVFVIYIAVTPSMLYFALLFCSRPRALEARVYHVKLFPAWNKHLSIYLSIVADDLGFTIRFRCIPIACCHLLVIGVTNLLIYSGS